MFNNETRIGRFHVRCVRYSDTNKCLDLLRNAVIISTVDSLIATNIYCNTTCIYIDISSNKNGFFTNDEIKQIKDNIISITKNIELDRCSFIEAETYVTLQPVKRRSLLVNNSIGGRLLKYFYSFIK